MKLTILGNNSAVPAYGRHPTSQIVNAGGWDLMLDCGEGTQMQMMRYGLRWRKLRYICISHLHGDHYFGLPGLLNSMSLSGRTLPLDLFAPAPLEQILQDLLSAGGNSSFSFPFSFHALPQKDASEILLEEEQLTIQSFPVVHKIECHGFLINEKGGLRKILPDVCQQYNIPLTHYSHLKKGADYRTEEGVVLPNDLLTAPGLPDIRYAYCADTLFTTDLLSYILGVDALYHESTYLHAAKEKAESRFHSTALQAAQLASMAGAGRLFLGHFSARYEDLRPFAEEAKSLFANTTLTVEGETYLIKSRHL